MAINFDEVHNSLFNIQIRVSKMLEIVDLARSPQVAVEHVGTFNFTTAQKTALKVEYESLKAEIANLFGELP